MRSQWAETPIEGKFYQGVDGIRVQITYNTHCYTDSTGQFLQHRYEQREK